MPMDRDAIDRRAREVEERLAAAMRDAEPLVVVKAPPGSGKTTILLRAAAAAFAAGQRVAVGAQTNSQANDVCRRFAEELPDLPVHRFASANAERAAFGPSVTWTTKGTELPSGACIVVSTAAKWGVTSNYTSFDVLLVDEAWQMAWAEFMPCGRTAARFVLIGDPGQIDPVISIPTDRWETAARPPHRPTPELVLADPTFEPLLLELPACRRLPHDSVELVRGFYDFAFGAWARPGERRLHLGAPGTARGRGRPSERRVGVDAEEAIERALGGFAERSVVAVTTPTPPEGPPPQLDRTVVDLVIATAERLLLQDTEVEFDGERRPLEPSNLGIVAIHRVMNDSIRRGLPASLRSDVMVDTPERWQGLERDVMIAVHPLSGAVRPSSFELETGRLCVMASRHRVALVVVSRDHVGSTLARHIPMADQALGRPDSNSRGHAANARFWDELLGSRVTAPA